MRSPLSLWLLVGVCTRASHAALPQQQILNDIDDTDVQSARVAIIGAGAAGSSAAYHVAQFAREADIPLELTVFERNRYIGGRTTTVHVYNESKKTAELGGSIFVQVNHILVGAVKAFGLNTTAPGTDVRAALDAPSLGIWDGESFVVTLSSGGPSWWDTTKILWRYGLAPIRTRNLMKTVVGKFLKMYDEPIFPFASLAKTVEDVELLNEVSVAGTALLESNNIGSAFAHDIIQASTRVNYAQNLDFIHGLETMVCMAIEGAMSVKGGNWQVFDRMIHSSNATVLTTTEVKVIHKGKNDMISVKYGSLDADINESHTADFDAVIIAAPFHQTNISVELSHFAKPDKVQYVELHVTLFTSPHALSPAYFNLPQGQTVPLAVLTTLPKDEVPGEGSRSAGSPGFYSISTLDVVENPHTGAEEYLYKIFSPEKPSVSWMIELLGVDEDDSADLREHITWQEYKLWKSYPIESPRTKFDEIELGKGVWYTGGMDPFISTMETNALMGKNVASLLAKQLFANRKTKSRTNAAHDASEL